MCSYFTGSGKRFVLTAAGEYYVGRCKEIETIQKEITIQMERFSSMSHGMIRIGVQPSFSDLVLKDIIPKFQESFPAVKNYFTGVFNRRADGAVEKTAGGCGAGNN